MKIKRRIVIIGDSLGMPRPFLGIRIESTYPYLLAENLGNHDYEVICKCKRANDSWEEVKDENILNDDINFLDPNYVVIHLGIVDCAPRLFSKTQTMFLNKLPRKVNEPIIKIFSKNRLILTRLFNKVYVKKKCYEKNIRKIIERVIKVGAVPIVINIADTNDHNKKKSYNFEKNIKKYNDILLKLCHSYSFHLIDIYSQSNPEKILLDDGIHLNENGNKILAGMIREKILSIENYSSEKI